MTPTKFKTFGEVLKEARLKKGYSTRALARALKVSPTLISRFEKGDKDPSERILKKICGFLSLDIKELRLRIEAERAPDLMRQYIRFVEPRYPKTRQTILELIPKHNKALISEIKAMFWGEEIHPVEIDVLKIIQNALNDTKKLLLPTQEKYYAYFESLNDDERFKLFKSVLGSWWIDKEKMTLGWLHPETDQPGERNFIPYEIALESDRVSFRLPRFPDLRNVLLRLYRKKLETASESDDDVAPKPATFETADPYPDSSLEIDPANVAPRSAVEQILQTAPLHFIEEALLDSAYQALHGNEDVQAGRGVEMFSHYQPETREKQVESSIAWWTYEPSLKRLVIRLKVYGASLRKFRMATKTYIFSPSGIVYDNTSEVQSGAETKG